MLDRTCAHCTLCCTLVPVKEIHKPANTPCVHESHAKGCAIYATRPLSCRSWSCSWLVDPSTRDLEKPARSGYVIDPMPDFVTITVPGEEPQRIMVVQIWCDPNRRDAHRDPSLRKWLGIRPGLVRWSSKEGMLIGKDETGKWHEVMSNADPTAEHTPEEIMNMMREMKTG